MSETDRLLSDKCWYKDHLNNPKSYKSSEFDQFNKLKVLFTVRKFLCFCKVVLIIMPVFYSMVVSLGPVSDLKL